MLGRLAEFGSCSLGHVHGRQGDDGAEEKRLIESDEGHRDLKVARCIAEIVPVGEACNVVGEEASKMLILQGRSRIIRRFAIAICGGGSLASRIGSPWVKVG